MDEDLTMEERRSRWRMVETARRERARKKRLEVNNRKLRVKGRRSGAKGGGAGKKMKRSDER